MILDLTIAILDESDNVNVTHHDGISSDLRSVLHEQWHSQYAQPRGIASEPCTDGTDTWDPSIHQPTTTASNRARHDSTPQVYSFFSYSDSTTFHIGKGYVTFSVLFKKL